MDENFIKGLESIEVKDYTAAIAYFKKSVISSNSEALYRIGEIYDLLNKFSEALSWYKKAVKYRQSIGQQKPYEFIYLMQWYSRFASGRKVDLRYDLEDKDVDNIL